MAILTFGRWRPRKEPSQNRNFGYFSSGGEMHFECLYWDHETGDPFRLRSDFSLVHLWNLISNYYCNFIQIETTVDCWKNNFFVKLCFMTMLFFSLNWTLWRKKKSIMFHLYTNKSPLFRKQNNLSDSMILIFKAFIWTKSGKPSLIENVYGKHLNKFNSRTLTTANRRSVHNSEPNLRDGWTLKLLNRIKWNSIRSSEIPRRVFIDSWKLWDLSFLSCKYWSGSSFSHRLRC